MASSSETNNVIFKRMTCHLCIIKKKLSLQGVLGSMVVVAFQITFCVEMHVNDIFLFFKKLFLTSANQNNPKRINYIKF